MGDEFKSLGAPVEVDWRGVVTAQRECEIAYLAVYEAIKMQALEGLR